MKICSYLDETGPSLAIHENGQLFDLGPGSLDAVAASGADLAAFFAALPRGRVLEPAAIRFLPVIQRPPKIVCVGLNYVDHAAESPYKKVPDYPAFFPRFAATLVGHGQPIIRPMVSTELDFEGELAVVIGKAGRHVSRENALDHVLGYTIFNDASLRDYQFKSAQWTVGKNFEGTGSLGPWLVTPEKLPPGGRGLAIQTRLNDAIVQSDTTASMIFNVEDLIFYISEVVSLEPGDVIATGTPAGVGFARNPKLFMKHGDVCDVSIEGIGTLVNPVRDEIREIRGQVAA